MFNHMFLFNPMNKKHKVNHKVCSSIVVVSFQIQCGDTQSPNHEDCGTVQIFLGLAVCESKMRGRDQLYLPGSLEAKAKLYKLFIMRTSGV